MLRNIQNVLAMSPPTFPFSLKVHLPIGKKIHFESDYSLTRLHWKVGGSGLCQRVVKGIDGTLLFLHPR